VLIELVVEKFCAVSSHIINLPVLMIQPFPPSAFELPLECSSSVVQGVVEERSSRARNLLMKDKRDHDTTHT